MISNKMLDDPPEINYKPVVSWALNDRLTERGLSSRLAAFKRCGYGGVLIMPWAGLPYRFMSGEWLDRVEWIILSAEKSNLEVWLWDDWLFPSGFAGGLVGQDNRCKSKTLKVSIDVVLENGERFDAIFPPRTIAAGVFPVDKHNNPAGDLKHLQVKPGSTIKYRSAGRNRLVVVGWDFISGMRHTVRSHSRCLMRNRDCNIYTCDDENAFSVDMLNIETAERYLNLIHEKYWRRFKKHFGKTVKGFFYDEPGIPSAYPWTYGLEKEFKAKKGYALTEYLVQIMVRRTFEGYDIPAQAWKFLKDEKVKAAFADYNDVWTGMMADNFYRVIQHWCNEHKVLSTGHQVSDESLRNLLSGSGTYFKNMDYSDMPGTDAVFNQITPGKFIDYPRFAGSRASVSGKRRALSESFAAMGHGLYLDEMRYLTEHQIIRGVNKFTPNLANYNPEKSYYFHPPELSPTKNPMIKKYGLLLHRRMERLCSLMSSGRPIEKICLYVPLNNYYLNEPEITEKIDYLARKLTYNHREYDYIWDNDLFSMEVKKGKFISQGGQKYSHIVIPPGAYVSDQVAAKLQALKSNGGRILACFPLPDPLNLQKITPPFPSSPTWGEDKGEGNLMEIVRTIDNLDELISHLGRLEQPLSVSPELTPSPSPLPPGERIKVRVKKGEFPYLQDTPVSSLTRRLDRDRYLTLFLNESTDRQCLEITCPDGWSLYEEDLNSGKIFRLWGGSDSLKVPLVFLPGESKLIIQNRTSRMPNLPYRPAPEQLKALSIDSLNLNLPGKKTVRITNPLPSWNELGYATYSGTMCYHTEFTWYKNTFGAVLDLGSVHYAATVFLDGRKAGDCVFTPYVLNLTNLTPGRHRLKVEVLNTPANSVCGTEQRYRRLEKKGVFNGTYAPLYLPLDRKRLVSGLLGPVVLFPTDL